MRLWLLSNVISVPEESSATPNLKAEPRVQRGQIDGQPTSFQGQGDKSSDYISLPASPEATPTLR